MASYENMALKALRQQVGSELGVMYLINNADIDSFQNNGITSVRRLANLNWGAGYWSSIEAGIYRPDSATAADNWRFLDHLTNSSGALTITGTYADTTVGSEIAEIWKYAGSNYSPGVEILNAFNQALKEEYTPPIPLALSHLSVYDGDMSDTSDTNWTDVGTPTTSAKTTTASRTPYGMRSYHLAATAAANSGTRSTSIPLAQSRYYSMFTIASVAVGTASLQPYNSTTGSTSEMPTAITTTEAEPQLMVIRNQHAPTSCHSLAMNMTNTSATGDTYWNQAWMYNLDNLIIHLPSYVSEHFKAPAIYQMIPRFSTSTTGQSVWNAQGVDMVPLSEGNDYRFSFDHVSANPYEVIFADRSAFQWPLVIQARRPYYDLVASGAGFSAETDTYPGPTRTFVNRCKIEVLKRIFIPAFPTDPKWVKLLQDAQADLDAASYARPIEALAPALPYYHGPTYRRM